jgi:hypothetical protein
LNHQVIKDRLSGADIGSIFAAVFGWGSGVVGTVLGAMAGGWSFLIMGSAIGFFAGPDIKRRFLPWLSKKAKKTADRGKETLAC